MAFSITEIISAVISAVSAGFTGWAALEARKSAKSAQESIRLIRPFPLVVGKFDKALKAVSYNTNDVNLHVFNIGTGQALDVGLEFIVFGKQKITFKTIRFLTNDNEGQILFIESLSGGEVDTSLSSVLSSLSDTQHSISFVIPCVLTYKSIDGRSFRVKCQFNISRITERVEFGPTDSWEIKS